jgi:predicted signal transduction protein with EAL and GGDEF domain
LIVKIKEYGIDPGLIEVEVTENMLVEDIDLASSILAKLRQSGIGREVLLADSQADHGYAQLAAHGMTPQPFAVPPVMPRIIASVLTTPRPR